MPRFRASIRTRLSAASELFGYLLRFVHANIRSQGSLVAENLFLRKQLALYQERKVRPHRLTDAARLTLVLWSRRFNWKDALIIVQPETLDRLASEGIPQTEAEAMAFVVCQSAGLPTGTASADYVGVAVMLSCLRWDTRHY